LLSLVVILDGAGGGGFRGLCSVELFALSIPVYRKRDISIDMIKECRSFSCEIYLSNVPCPVDESPLGDLL